MRGLVWAALVAIGCQASAGAPAPRASPGSGPGPAVGETMPRFALPDQDGRMRDWKDLVGPRGLVVNFNRSVVW